MRTAIARTALAALLACATLAHADADPAIGTWVLNVAKSRFDPGPPPRSLVVRFEADPKGVKSTSDLVDAEGNKTRMVYAAAYDGKDYPLTGSPNVDTVVLRKHEGWKVERVDKKAGVVVQTFLRRVSDDGKTMTVTHKTKGANGALVHNRLVFDRR